jgi:flagellar basal body-associated protein FliL
MTEKNRITLIRVISLIILSIFGISAAVYLFAFSTRNQNSNQSLQTSSSSSISTQSLSQPQSSLSSSSSSSSIQLKTLEDSRYPDLKVKYDQNEWYVIAKDIENFTQLEFFDKKKNSLRLTMTPAIITGFTGPIPCYTSTAKLKDDLVRAINHYKSDENEKIAEVIFYTYPKNFVFKPSPEFNSSIEQNYDDTLGIAKEKFDSCGARIYSFLTKTTLPTPELLNEDLKQKAFVSITLHGPSSSDPEFLSKADMLVQSLIGLSG